MSRWLKSVNTLLEQLDDKVETAVEEQVAARAVSDDGAEHAQGRDAVDSILAKRGYMQEDEENKVEEMMISAEPENVEEKQSAVTKVEDSSSDRVEVEEALHVASVESVEEPSPQAIETKEETLHVSMEEDVIITETKSQESQQKTPPASAAETQEEEEEMEDVLLESEPMAGVGEENVTPESSVPKKEDPEPVTDTVESQVQSEPPVVEAKPPPANPKAAAHAPDKVASAPPTVLTQQAPSVLESEYKKALADAREAQKECRTLRRHVVSLNSELESAEAEIQAQRTELERAAERMEKDRTRQKEEKERLVTRHADELKALTAQHEKTVKELKARAEQQAQESLARMKELEQRRMQEGGDWTKEMENALHREQEAVRRMANLEDEKSTLLSHISMLEAQQSALENRLDSVSLTADNAMEREREAEDRLDAALSMHARQLTQRQAREAELERTIADLGAALVVARNKEVNRLKSGDPSDSTAGERGGNDVAALRTRLEDSEDQKETILAQLELERQRCLTMQQDLQELSKERTEEAAAAHARQLQSDRKIADMSVTISRLQASQRDTKKKSSFGENRESVYSSDDGDQSTQIQSLSEQVMKQQDTIARSKSEISALKNRLKVAVSRADKAEEALSSVSDTDGLYDRMESAPLSSSSDVGRRTMRRRGGRRSSSDAVSIRSAIYLPSGQSQNGEKIGKAIDAVDSFSVQTGKYLRSNPLARAGFLLYLFMIHLWTFILLIFHAHGFETVHGDFGAGHEVPHGPHALMQAQSPETNP